MGRMRDEASRGKRGGVGKKGGMWRREGEGRVGREAGVGEVIWGEGEGRGGEEGGVGKRGGVGRGEGCRPVWRCLRWPHLVDVAYLSSGQSCCEMQKACRCCARA